MKLGKGAETSAMRNAYRLFNGPPAVGDSRFVKYNDELKQIHGHEKDPDAAWKAFTRSLGSELGSSRKGHVGSWATTVFEFDHKSRKGEGSMITRLA